MKVQDMNYSIADETRIDPAGCEAVSKIWIRKSRMLIVEYDSNSTNVFLNTDSVDQR